MAVVVSDSCGAVLDHAAFKILMSVSDPRAPNANSYYTIKKEYFGVYTPFYMDSQAQRLIRESKKDVNSVDSNSPHTYVKETSAQRKRRKKKAPPLTDEAQKVSDLLVRTLSYMLKKAKENNLFLKVDKDFLCVYDNNKGSRLSSLNSGCGDVFQELCSLSEETPKIIENKVIVIDKQLLTENYCLSYFINKRVENPADIGVFLNVENHQFLIPSASRFIMSTYSSLVSEFYRYLEVPGGYDLIVLDPPWYNKSVKRKKSYNTFDESELCLLPVSVLSKPEGLICVWVTNNERILSYVKDVLFPGWNVEWVADWFWMKVTQCGEPVCDIQSTHKKPFERLIIGRHKDVSDQPVSSMSDVPPTDKSCDDEKYEHRHELLRNCDGEKGNEAGKESDEIIYDKSQYVTQPPVPRDFVLVSVPCTLHSKKPPLSEVFTTYLPSKPKRLELFARNLLPGWTSWGNEVLRHQHTDHFDVKANSEERK